MKKDLKKLAALAVALTLMLSTILPAFALGIIPESVRMKPYWKGFRAYWLGTDDEAATYDEAAYLEKYNEYLDDLVKDIDAEDPDIIPDLVAVCLTDEAEKHIDAYSTEDFAEYEVSKIDKFVHRSRNGFSFMHLIFSEPSYKTLKKAVIELSERDDFWFVEINCKAIPDELPNDPAETEPVEPEPTEPTPTEPTPTEPTPTEPAPVITEPGENDITLGDLDGDGVVNAKDRIILTRHLAKWSGYETIDEQAADLDKDGKAEAKDRIILTRHLAKWQGYEAL